MGPWALTGDMACVGDMGGGCCCCCCCCCCGLTIGTAATLCMVLAMACGGITPGCDWGIIACCGDGDGWVPEQGSRKKHSVKIIAPSSAQFFGFKHAGHADFTLYAGFSDWKYINFKYRKYKLIFTCKNERESCQLQLVLILKNHNLWHCQQK